MNRRSTPSCSKSITVSLRLVSLSLSSFALILAGFHKLLDRELFAFGSLHIFNTSFYIKELFFQLHFLAFHAHRDFFKLTMPDDNCIVIARSNAPAELLAVARFKILLGRNKDIGARIEPQIFGSH